MDPFGFIGGLISGGLNFLTGNSNRAAQEQANAQNVALQRETNAQNRQAFLENMAFQREYADKNLANQKEFAQQGIRWKVADAKTAGLHPLAALGSQVSSFSPISVGTNSLGAEAPQVKAATSDYGSMGQDISRAIQATATQEEKTNAYTQTLQALQLERGSLENQLLKAQILKAAAGPATPSFPTTGDKMLIDGQPATDLATPAGAAVTADKIEQKADSIPAHHRIRPAGVRMYSNPWFTDAEDLETRYGNLVENIGGIANLGADGVYTLYKLRNQISKYLPNPWRGPTFNERFHY